MYHWADFSKIALLLEVESSRPVSTSSQNSLNGNGWPKKEIIVAYHLQCGYNGNLPYFQSFQYNTLPESRCLLFVVYL